MLAQLIRLLSQPPGTIIYHLVTLFAIQAVLALALWQWRQARLQGKRDLFAGRLLVAAGGMLVLRLLLLLVTVVVLNRPDLLLPSQVLPPLEQAFNSTALVLVIWALVESPPRWPRLAAGLALFFLLIIWGMWLSFAQSWSAQAITSGPYNSTVQATIWAWFQIILLGGGLLWLSLRRPHPTETALRLSILGVLLLAHLAHLWNYPEIIPSGSDIAYWIRLGHLVALPLLAILAYRYTISSLMLTTGSPDDSQLPAGSALDSWLGEMLPVLRSLQPHMVAAAAVQLAGRCIGADLVALVLIAEDDTEAGPVWVADPAASKPPSSPAQSLALSRWASLRLALEQRQTLTLQAGGMGAYQLQELAAELQHPGLVQMMVEPLLVNDNPLGVLIVGNYHEMIPPAGKGGLPLIAAICAQAIANAQAHQRALHDVAPLTATTEALISGRIVALENERDQALAQNQLFYGRLEEAEKRNAQEQEYARRLAHELARLQEQHPAAEQATRLEEEITVLREALFEAEEAMSMIAASEGGLSADWVLMTISRYSGELEAAQMRISELEAQLARTEPGRIGRIITSLLQELRSPLTSIEGYTDLLLAESTLVVNSQQRDFLQRVKANAARVHMLLEQIVRVADTAGQTGAEEKEIVVDVRREVENAVSMVLSQLRKKHLTLNLDVEDDLLPLPLRRNDLCDIVVHLLNNACLASTSHGQMTLRAHMDGTVTNSADRQVHRQHYFHISVSDSSNGISPEDLPHVFDPQYEAGQPLIAGMGETNAGLAVAEAMVGAHGGRLWVDSRQGAGNTFSILLPAPAGNEVGEGRA